MSNTQQTTYRFFVNDKRVATAVLWKTGSKHMSPILEVYPRQSTILPHGRPLMSIFHSEDAWRNHCLEDYVPKQKSRVETVTKKKSDPKLDKVRPYRLDNTEAITHRFFVGDKYMATAVVYGCHILQVSPRLPGSRMFENLQIWTKHCEENYNPQPVTRFEVTKKEVKETTTPVFTPKKNWICPACNKGPGNDHRMCICSAFNFSIADWEIAIGIRPPVPGNAPPPEPISTAPTTVPARVIARQAAAATVNDWEFKQTHKFTAPPGEYYIGDLCYALSDGVYDAIFGNLGGYDSGLYLKKGTSDFFMLDNTAYGDGLYEGTDGKEFAVDAGIIGICSKSLCEKDCDGGHMYTFKEPVKIGFGGGIFNFRSGARRLTINTAGEDEDSE